MTRPDPTPDQLARERAWPRDPSGRLIGAAARTPRSSWSFDSEPEGPRGPLCSECGQSGHTSRSKLCPTQLDAAKRLLRGGDR